jgi:hypothetical protein
MFVVGLRFWNILAMGLGRMEAWGLTNSWTHRSSTAYVLPFLFARRHDNLPVWVGMLLAIAWLGLVVGLCYVLYCIRRYVGGESDNSDRSEAPHVRFDRFAQ